MVKNFSRSVVSPIVTCVACGQDNVQPRVGLFLHVLTVAGAVTTACVAAQRMPSAGRGAGFVIAVWLLVELAWWRFVADLAPHHDDARPE